VQLSLKAAAHGASAKRFAGEDDYGEQLRVNYFAFLWLQNVMSFFFSRVRVVMFFLVGSLFL
jgi:hypothetical protein